MNMYLNYCGFHKFYHVDGGPFQSEDLGLPLVWESGLIYLEIRLLFPSFSSLPQDTNYFYGS